MSDVNIHVFLFRLWTSIALEIVHVACSSFIIVMSALSAEL